MEQDLPAYYTPAPGDTGLGDLSSLLQGGPAYDPSQITPSYEFGSGPVVYATENPAAADELNRSMVELGKLLNGLSINPDAFLERLYITGELKRSIERAGLDVVSVVTNLLNLILALEVKVQELELSDEYSYVNKYIICGPQGQYGLDIRELSHYNNTLEALNRVAALHDIGGPNELLRSAFLVVEENFSIGSGLDQLQNSLIEECRQRGAEFLKGVSNIYEKTRAFTIGKVENVVKQLSSRDPHVASHATRQIITHSLKITSYLYGIIQGTVFIADNLTMLLGQVLSYGADIASYLMSITQVGFGLYTFFMDVLVLSPSPTAYSVLFCIFLIKKYNLGKDFYDSLVNRLSAEKNKYIDDFKRQRDNILAHRESAGNLMGEFNEFSEYVLGILGEPVAQGVEKFKQLRFLGVEARLDSAQFHGLGVDKRAELMEMLVSGEGNAVAPELTAEQIQELEDLEDPTWEPTGGPRVPDIVISERNSKGRFIFTENVSSHPLPTFFAVKPPPVAIGTDPMSQFAFGKSKKKKKKNAKGRNTRRRRR